MTSLTPRARRLAERAQRRADTCARKKAYPNTPEGRRLAWRAARTIARKELAGNVVHRMTVYICLHDSTHVHVGSRGRPFTVGSQGSLNRAGWAAALDEELARTAAQLEEKIMQLSQAQAAIVDSTSDYDFWRARAIDELAVVADGHCYALGEHCAPAWDFRGFGGRRWLIRFHDGRELCTQNLWHNGEVPAAYRNALPDNATLECIPLGPVILPESPDDLPW